jgi:uncharacterized protein
MTLPGHLPLPVLTPENAFFWTAGRMGSLAILRCDDCGAWLHPPSPLCQSCLSRNLTPRDVSGLGVVETFTINHQAWTQALPVPYAIVIVSLDDCPGLRLTSRLVGCEPADVAIGMRVTVYFEQHDNVWLPLFAPA